MHKTKRYLANYEILLRLTYLKIRCYIYELDNL